jgi:hypothetical protein
MIKLMAKQRKEITTDIRPRDDSWGVIKNIKNPNTKPVIANAVSPKKTF